MTDQDKLTTASEIALKKGLRVLQGFRLEDTDQGHVAALLAFMAPGRGTKWVDLGCGFGEPAKLMKELRPDLMFWLVNNNTFQLSKCPPDMPTFCCDMHDMSFDPGEFDGAMFLYSLCHADDFVVALREAARVVRPGGKLFVYDYVRFDGDDALAHQHLNARFIPFDMLRAVARAGDWDLESFVLPRGSDAVFRSLMPNQHLYNLIFKGLRPILWKAVRR
jgi:ubiquinone/menaquinone biosynthesis C-methylase UbiE